MKIVDRERHENGKGLKMGKNIPSTQTISAKIKAVREYLNLTLNAFGRSLGYAGTSIKRFENGDLRTRKGEEGQNHPVVEKICDIYGVDRMYFYGDLALTDAVQKGNRSEKEIIERLETARAEKGLGVVELNNLAGLSSGHLSRIEHRDTALTRQTAEKLADTLDVGVDWLMQGDENKKSYPVSKKLIDWLWENEDVRKELWEKYRESREIDR